MGWLILSILGGMLGAIVGYSELSQAERKNWKKYVAGISANVAAGFLFVGVITGIVGGVIGGVESGKVQNGDYSDCTIDVVTYPIISTIREKTVSGSFILGTGGVNSVDRYYAYVEYEPGMLLKTFRTRDTYIVEGANSPHFARSDYMCPRTFRNWFFFGEGEPRRNKGHGALHVPTDTILREFRL